MATELVSMRNIKFLLYEVLNGESLTQYPYFEEHSREIYDMTLDTAMKLGKDLLLPCFSEMDKNPPEFVNGEVRVLPIVKTILKEFGEGGWTRAQLPYDQGGQQLPNMIMMLFRYILTAYNFAGALFPFLSAGSANLILSFGSQELIDTYVEKMLSGQWQGTMALTEPQAGSSLTDLTSSAYPTDQGYYKVKGQKIFISAAEHDCVDNVINLLLARIEGAPPGVKGLSLFVVPKKRINNNGEFESNDLVCTGIYHKLGWRGTPLTQLSFGENDDCRAWLVGEPNQGLRYMFQLMNDARVLVGMSATATASAAYYTALNYTKERPQGRKITEKDPTQPQIPIIEHTDVKRMLLFQRAIVDGSLSLCLQNAKYLDLHQVLDGEEKEKIGLLLDILTPVVKSYPSEMGIQAVSQGLQCLGGYGFCDEFPLEQYYRDMRIHPIHEGTTGIQAMDLLGRKVIMKNGQAMSIYLEELAETIRKAQETEELVPQAEALSAALEELKKVTKHLTGFAQKGQIDLFLSDATLYLELFGIISVAWQWLLQATVAVKAIKDGQPSKADMNFYQGKLVTFRFFFAYELPKIKGLTQRLMNTDGLAMEMPEEFFED